MKTISDLRHAFQMHVADIEYNNKHPTTAKNIWNKILHNRRMKKRSTYRKRGGAAYTLQGADLNYTMTPGSAFTTNPAVAVYDRFPIDPTVNPQVVSDLDVYFNSALSRSCGVENMFPKVPANMGSNQVGGKRSRRYRKQGGALTPAFWDSIKDSGEALGNHPYLATPYPNMLHSATFNWTGRESIPTSSDPTDHTWNLATEKPYDNVMTPTATVLGQSDSLMRTWPTTGAPQPAPPTAVGGKRKSRKSHRKMRKTYKNRK